MVDFWFYGLSELHYLVWRFIYPTLDRYIIKQREHLRTDLNAAIEAKGPELFGSKEEFERKRVLKDGAVSMKRIKTVLSLSALLPDPLNIGELTQDIFSQIIFYECLLVSHSFHVQDHILLYPEGGWVQYRAPQLLYAQ